MCHALYMLFEAIKVSCFPPLSFVLHLRYWLTFNGLYVRLRSPATWTDEPRVFKGSFLKTIISGIEIQPGLMAVIINSLQNIKLACSLPLMLFTHYHFKDTLYDASWNIDVFTIFIAKLYNALDIKYWYLPYTRTTIAFARPIILYVK